MHLWIKFGNTIKNNFIPRTRDYLKFYSLSGATFYECINTIYQFIKPFLVNKMSVFEEYGAFNMSVYWVIYVCAYHLKRQVTFAADDILLFCIFFKENKSFQRK